MVVELPLVRTSDTPHTLFLLEPSKVARLKALTRWESEARNKKV